MTDRTMLLAAILADKQNNMPRKAYAECLDNEGDSVRAEFIRVQCEMEETSCKDSGLWSVCSSITPCLACQRSTELIARSLQLPAEGLWPRSQRDAKQASRQWRTQAMNRTIDKFVLVVTVMLTVLALAIVVTHRQKPVAVPKEVQYWYLGDKSRPDTWLRKYSVPAAYYVWDD